MSTEPDWMAAAEALAREIKRQEGLYRHAAEAMLKAGSLQNAIKEYEARLVKLAKEESEAKARAVKSQAAAQDAQRLADEAGRETCAKANIEASQIVAEAKRNGAAVVARAEASAKKLQDDAQTDRAAASAALAAANAAAKQVKEEIEIQNQNLASVLAEVRRVEALRDTLRGQLAGAVA